MSTAITSIHVTVAIILMISVLLQSGKGSGLGAAFGGSSSSVFGSRGPATLISRVTSVAAVIFMVTSLTLSIFAQGGSSGSVITEDEALPAPVVPVEGRAVSEEDVQLPAGATLAVEEAPEAGDAATADEAAPAGDEAASAGDEAASAPPAGEAPAAGEVEAAPAPIDEAPAAGEAETVPVDEAQAEAAEAPAPATEAPEAAPAPEVAAPETAPAPEAAAPETAPEAGTFAPDSGEADAQAPAPGE